MPSDDGDLPAHEVLTYAEARADDLNRLAFLIADWPEHTRAAIARLWPTPDVLAYPAQVRAGEATWTDDDLPMLRSIFTGASAPFNIYTEKPSQPVTSRPSIAEPVVYSGYEPADPADIELLLNAVRESGEVETVNRWLGEAHGAGVGWSPRKMPNVRCFEICRTALALADVCGDTADDVALALIDLALDAADTDPTEPVGAVLGQLTPQQAADVAEQAAALKAGRTLLVYDADGYPILTPAN